MSKPLTVFETAEAVFTAPVGTIARAKGGGILEIWEESEYEGLAKCLPARVLRWGEDHYPTGFERVIKTLADIAEDKRKEYRWAQCELLDGTLGVISDVGADAAIVLVRSGGTLRRNAGNIILRLDLPRMVWPGEEPKEPPVVSEWVGRKLFTEKDFRDAPVGTVCTDVEGDPALKLSEDKWSYVGADSTHKNMANEVCLPFTVIAVAES